MLALIAIVLFPTALAYVVTHTLSSEVPVANLGATHEEVTFETSDGLRLEGWFVPSQNGATVIIAPGRSGSQKQARMLIRHGYGMLLFDRMLRVKAGTPRAAVLLGQRSDAAASCPRPDSRVGWAAHTDGLYPPSSSCRQQRTP